MPLLKSLFGWIGKLLGWLVGKSEPGAPQPSPGPTPVTPPSQPESPPIDMTPNLPPQPEAPTQPQAPEPPSPEPGPRQWTLMVYMAGDNGLKFPTDAGWTQIMAEMTSAGYTDITEMRNAGTTDQVACLVQFDTVTEADRSYRIVINAKGQEPTVLTIPETNTGDPDTLRDFIVWGQENFPAEHYLVVLWNHGGGWKEDDLWASVRSVQGSAPRRPALFRPTAKALSRTIQRTVSPQAGEDPVEELRRARSGGGAARSALPAGAAQPRWIAADDSSKDFLDNEELQRAFREAQEITGQAVDIIGMDACLMAMVEVAYQLRREAQILVASEEVEPMAGWPYTAILEQLNQRPQQSPEELARTIVRLYGESYSSPTVEITQSAVRLGRLEPLVAQLRAFVEAVMAHWNDPAIPVALERARMRTIRFEDSDYRDLVDFLQRVQAELARLRADERVSDTGAIDAVNQAAASVLALFADPQRTPVLETLVKGQRYLDPDTGQPRVHGLAVYLPDDRVSVYYDGLDFAESGWPDLLRLMLGSLARGDAPATS